MIIEASNWIYNKKHWIESLAENKIKNKVEQLLSYYKHRKSINEHRKHQIEWTTLFVFSLLERLDEDVKISMLPFKTYLFITRGKIYETV